MYLLSASLWTLSHQLCTGVYMYSIVRHLALAVGIAPTYQRHETYAYAEQGVWMRTGNGEERNCAGV